MPEVDSLSAAAPDNATYWMHGENATELELERTVQTYWGPIPER